MTRTSQLIRALRPRRGGRLPLALLVAVGAVGVTAAVSDAGTAPPGLRFAQIGHWIASPAQGTVFHVNGASRTVDAQARVDGMDRGSQVVQGPTSGYVVSKDKILEFGKSSLAVEQSMTPPTGEQPVAVEAKGGPYLVYREAGTVVRLGGGEPATIPAGRGLGQPVVTPDGTLWLQRTDSNVLCLLTADTDRLSCPASAPVGHTGALSVVGRQAVFVDTRDDTLTPVSAGGLGRATKAGVDLPADAKIAGADVGGRIAVVDPSAGRLHLVDGSGVRDGRAGRPLTRELPAGEYAPPAAGRSSVVLLDLRGNTVRTYDREGRPQRVTAVPPEAGEARLGRGEDQRVYVDGGEGRHVLVVGDDGSAGAVPLIGTPTSGAAPRPQAPPTEKPAGPATPRPPTPAAGPPAPGAPRPQVETPTRDRAPRRPATADRPRSRTTRPSGATARPPRATARPPRATATPPSRPGMPRGLAASAQGTTIRVTWRAAAANGAAVTGYRVTWTAASGGGGGTVNRSGGSRSATLTGLTRGVSYRITVAAQNSAGRGAAATTRATVPRPARSVTVSRGRTTSHSDDCTPPDCAYIRVEMRGFAPNRSYQIEVFSSEWGNFNPGARLRTDRSGTLIVSDRFPFNGVGQRVWVTVDGLESNHYRWPRG
ncbi:fibronectin type III domain-containing protein [Jidongwangia harbinensis]|uniref:fibronectin type III domain-containing protein n=1 Tax=Jidongwangia harbinensis TaxID=2878561 RepID=UPI001CDA4CE8|nr:fibronectin type III domain-containing protein [Jidongwangia harbinensis]MCA2218170.1 fibronectin type III domain-containing protein [Jidongwangia harbinensis]